jgi:hypothetical protein
MKLVDLRTACNARARRGLQGMTLAEMMTATAVFSLAVLGMVYGQLFGMRQDQLLNSKSGASEQARMSFNDMTSDIKSSKIWAIGNWTSNSFVPVPNGTAQQGNALQLSLTTDTNQYILYYFNTNTAELWRWHSGASTQKMLTSYLTNTMYFAAETYSGAMQTNLSHKGVIHVLMQFCQYQYPITRIGPNYFYNYYQLGFRVTPHVPDGP